LATWPRSISFRRWQNGEEIASTPLLPTMEDSYGFPYFLIHRGDLHRVLLDKALEVGVVIRTGTYVSDIDEAQPAVTLASGEKCTADLIIGADGKYLAMKQKG
jgi:salicylate hydroxylase